MTYQELNKKTIREGFNRFNKEHPEIFKEFEKYALVLIIRGHNKVSSKFVLNWIRWNVQLDLGKNFKINDAYQSYYGRCFVEKYPEYAKFFTFRKLRNEEDGPYMVENIDGTLSFL